MFLGEICRWILLFHEFDFEIIVKLGHLNAGLDHLSWIKIGEELTNTEYGLPNAQLFIVGMVDNYYEQIVQFLAGMILGAKFIPLAKLKEFQIFLGRISYIKKVFRVNIK